MPVCPLIDIADAGHRQIRRNNEVISTLMEKIHPNSPAGRILKERVEKILNFKRDKSKTLVSQRLLAQKSAIHLLLRHQRSKCFFCKRPLHVNQKLTTHHVNGNHEDNRPVNKRLAHETCHRVYNYDEVQPRNTSKN